MLALRYEVDRAHPRAIEADRDRRIARRAYAPAPYRTTPHVAVTIAEADPDGERWVDEGGSFDREFTAAVRSRRRHAMSTEKPGGSSAGVGSTRSRPRHGSRS